MGIRRAREEDCEAIAAVLRAAFAEFRPLYTVQAYEATTPPAKMVAARLAEGPTWLADLDGATVGTVSAVKREAGVHVRAMAVLPRARGSGVGRALLAEVERHAMDARATRVTLSTTPFLDAAIRLYERAGYTRTDEGPHDLHGTLLLTMEKRLAR